MFRGLLFASLLCAGLLAQAAAAACLPYAAADSNTVTAIYPVADLVIVIDTRPVTMQIGQELKIGRHRPKQSVQTMSDQLIRKITAAVEPGTWHGPQSAGTIEYRRTDMARRRESLPQGASESGRSPRGHAT